MNMNTNEFKALDDVMQKVLVATSTEKLNEFDTELLTPINSKLSVLVKAQSAEVRKLVRAQIAKAYRITVEGADSLSTLNIPKDALAGVMEKDFLKIDDSIKVELLKITRSNLDKNHRIYANTFAKISEGIYFTECALVQKKVEMSGGEFWSGIWSS